MAISTGKQSGVTADINVTPMIDVMLVLLIIFMIVTPLIAAGFHAVLPVGANLDKDPEGDNEVVLGIDRNGRFFLDKRPISDEALLDQLTAIYSAREDDKILYFEADQGIKYGRIQEAVEIGREAGVRVLHAVTEPSRKITLGGEE